MRARFLALLVLTSTGAAYAQISGTVVDSSSGDPIADARVRVQTTITEPAISDAGGMFSLAAPGAVDAVVTAVLPYDPNRSANYITGSVRASDGDSVTIELTRLPSNDAMPYQPSTSAECATCHFDQFQQWNESRHAGAGVNPWVLDLFSGDGTPGGSNGYVFRDTHAPGQTGFCATCHTPLADAQNPGGEMLDEVTLPGGLDGVNCLACHQMAEVNDNTDALHHLGNTLYRFPDASSPSLWVWGPLDDVSFDVMRASYQPQFSESKFCASCHQYNNPDTGAPGQTTYDEWLASPFSKPGPGFRSCQDCHMPAADEPGPISTLFGQPVRAAEQRRNHSFVGSTPETLDRAIDLSLDTDLDADTLEVRVEARNAGAGHAFPTGVSIRNAVMVVEATADGVRLPLISGPTIPFYGSAEGGSGSADVAGLPGRGFARVLEGRINGTGPTVFPVLFIDAEGVRSDTRILAGESDLSSYRFDLAGIDAGEIQVEARILYRRAWRDLAVTKGWTETPSGDPVETEVERAAASVFYAGPPRPIPVLAPAGLAALTLLLMVVAARAKSHRGHRPRGSRR